MASVVYREGGGRCLGGSTQGCGNSHNVMKNVSVKLQLTNDRTQL
jgi:hypothetical protein